MRETYSVCYVATPFKFVAGIFSRLSSCCRISDLFCPAQDSAVESQDSTSLDELDTILSVFDVMKLVSDPRV